MKALKEHKSLNEDIFEISIPSLRKAILAFFGWVRQRPDIDIIAKMDNDCLVPKNWLSDIVDVFYLHEVDILSPNVRPSNAAYVHGDYVDGLNYRPSKIVGGLWVMHRSMIEGIEFVDYEVDGIRGGFPLLKQIVFEKEAKVGWVPHVTVEDMGHWSGEHPEHIKSKEHETYSKSVGRDIVWGSS